MNTNNERMSDRNFLLRFGDMCSDWEIMSMLDRMSSEDYEYVYRECAWLSEGPPWEGFIIQGSEEIGFNLADIDDQEGRCVDCGEPAEVPGRDLCFTCYCHHED